MQHKNGLDKVSQIISISNNYLHHQKNLKKIKGLVDHSNPKRNSHLDDYLTRKNTYKQIRNRYKDRIIDTENEKLVGRITSIAERNNSSSRVSSRSNASLNKTLLDQVNNYKTRRNFLKTKEMKRQNKSMTERVKNAHFKESFSPKNCRSVSVASENFKKVHSKFSDRSQQQMHQILTGLNLDWKKVPFLPLLPSPRHSKR